MSLYREFIIQRTRNWSSFMQRSRSSGTRFRGITSSIRQSVQRLVRGGVFLPTLIENGLTRVLRLYGFSAELSLDRYFETWGSHLPMEVRFYAQKLFHRERLSFRSVWNFILAHERWRFRQRGKRDHTRQNG